MNGPVDLYKFDSLFKILSTVRFLPSCNSQKVSARYTPLVSLSEINTQDNCICSYIASAKGTKQFNFFKLAGVAVHYIRAVYFSEIPDEDLTLSSLYTLS